MARATESSPEAHETALAGAPLAEQIRALEARLSRGRARAASDLATLGRSVHQKLGSPVALAIGAGVGFLLGEFAPRRRHAAVRVGSVAILRMLLQTLTVTQQVLSMLPEGQKRQPKASTSTSSSQPMGCSVRPTHSASNA